MAHITLIGEAQAKIGNRFYFTGPLNECKDCRLKGVCLNLESGHLYEIVGLRDVEHDCEIHESKVRAVEVEKKPMGAAMLGKKAMEGSVITFEPIQCDMIGCENYRYCRPPAIRDGMKLTVDSIDGDAECPRGNTLVLVRLC